MAAFASLQTGSVEQRKQKKLYDRASCLLAAEGGRQMNSKIRSKVNRDMLQKIESEVESRRTERLREIGDWKQEEQEGSTR